MKALALLAGVLAGDCLIIAIVVVFVSGGPARFWRFIRTGKVD